MDCAEDFEGFVECQKLLGGAVSWALQVPLVLDGAKRLLPFPAGRQLSRKELGLLRLAVELRSLFLRQVDSPLRNIGCKADEFLDFPRTEVDPQPCVAGRLCLEENLGQVAEDRAWLYGRKLVLVSEKHEASVFGNRVHELPEEQQRDH